MTLVVAVPKGAVTLACRHLNPEGPHLGVHVYKLGDEDGGVEISVTPRSGDDVQGRVIHAMWLLLCDSCDRSPGRPIEKARHHFTVPEEITVRSKEASH